jgi:hypothetical protein
MRFRAIGRRIPSRIRLRGLMLALAITSLPLAFYATVEARRSRFLQLAEQHRSQIVSVHGTAPYFKIIYVKPGGRFLTESELRRDDWHWQLWVKYSRAAERPWMPLRPDPPKPEPF